MGRCKRKPVLNVNVGKSFLVLLRFWFETVFTVLIIVYDEQEYYASFNMNKLPRDNNIFGTHSSAVNEYYSSLFG